MVLLRKLPVLVIPTLNRRREGTGNWGTLVSLGLGRHRQLSMGSRDLKFNVVQDLHLEVPNSTSHCLHHTSPIHQFNHFYATQYLCNALSSGYSLVAICSKKEHPQSSNPFGSLRHLLILPKPCAYSHVPGKRFKCKETKLPREFYTYPHGLMRAFPSTRTTPRALSLSQCSKSRHICTTRLPEEAATLNAQRTVPH